jgi:hypothetical protein
MTAVSYNLKISVLNLDWEIVDYLEDCDLMITHYFRIQIQNGLGLGYSGLGLGNSGLGLGLNLDWEIVDYHEIAIFKVIHYFPI